MNNMKNLVFSFLLFFGINVIMHAAPKTQQPAPVQPAFSMNADQQVTFNGLDQQDKINFQKMSRPDKIKFLAKKASEKAAQKSEKDAQSKKAASKAAPKAPKKAESTVKKTFDPSCRMLYWHDETKKLVGSKDSTGTCHHPDKEKAAKGEKGECTSKLSFLYCPNKKSLASDKQPMPHSSALKNSEQTVSTKS